MNSDILIRILVYQLDPQGFPDSNKEVGSGLSLTMQIMVFMRLHSIGQDHWENQATSYSTCNIGVYAPCKGRAILRTGLLDTRMCTFLVGIGLTLRAAESWFIQVDVTSDKSKIR